MTFDKDKAQHAIDFLQALKHAGNWRGQPFELVEWQHTLVKDVFGTVKEDGYRQYNTAFLEVPKKNGKTELAAGVGLYLTCGDGEQGAEVYGVATDRQQASIAFDVAVEMVDQCPALKKRIQLTLSQKHMLYLPTRSFYKVLSGETKGKHGYKVHGVIFDELHEQRNRALYDVLTFGSGATRMQPLTFTITTAGDDPDRKSLAWSVHKKALAVIADPEIDRTFYPVVYGIGEDDDPKDERNWFKANPSLGITMNIDAVRREWNAVQSEPELERKFRQLRLNQWVKTKASKWMSLSLWDATAGLTPQAESLKGRPCYGGLDLSSTYDLTAFILVFPPLTEDEKYQVLAWFWVPEDNMHERVKRDNVPYDKWVREGFMKTTPGNIVDYSFIEKTILDLRGLYDVREVGYDSWNATSTTLRLADEGVTMVPVSQAAQTQSPVLKMINVLTAKKLFRHGGHPVLRWNMGNANVRVSADDNFKLIKDKASERIDGAAALVNAMARALAYAKADQADTGPLTLKQTSGVKMLI